MQQRLDTNCSHGLCLSKCWGVEKLLDLADRPLRPSGANVTGCSAGWSTVRLCSLLWLLVNGQLCNFWSMVNQFCHLDFQLELRVQTIQIKGSWRNKRQRQNQNIIQWDSLRSALYKQKSVFCSLQPRMSRSMVNHQILMAILLPLVSVSSFSQNELAQLPLGENTLFDFSYISQKFSFLFPLSLLLYSILHRGDYEYLNFQTILKFNKYI